MMIRKLSAMPYAQAHVEITPDGTTTLVSYTTDIITIRPNGWATVSGLYSMTTRKHISAFAKEYTSFNYATFRDIYEKSLALNIHTGEVVPESEVA